MVTKPGYATATQQVNLGSGEADTGVSILLELGDGSVSGTVSGPKGPLGGATISATGGTSANPVTSSTVSLTRGKPGSFVLEEPADPGELHRRGDGSRLCQPNLERCVSAGAAADRACRDPDAGEREHRRQGVAVRREPPGRRDRYRQRRPSVGYHRDP